jgi:hypothetical protein
MAKQLMNLPKYLELIGQMIMSQMQQQKFGEMKRKNKEIEHGDFEWYLNQKTATIAINEYVNNKKGKTILKRYRARVAG